MVWAWFSTGVDVWVVVWAGFTGGSRPKKHKQKGGVRAALSFKLLTKPNSPIKKPGGGPLVIRTCCTLIRMFRPQEDRKIPGRGDLRCFL